MTPEELGNMPAAPCEWLVGGSTTGNQYQLLGGLTKREYMAIQFTAALAVAIYQAVPDTGAEACAKTAIHQADVLLAALAGDQK